MDLQARMERLADEYERQARPPETLTDHALMSAAMRIRDEIRGVHATGAEVKGSLCRQRSVPPPNSMDRDLWLTGVDWT